MNEKKTEIYPFLHARRHELLHLIGLNFESELGRLHRVRRLSLLYKPLGPVLQLGNSLVSKYKHLSNNWQLEACPPPCPPPHRPLLASLGVAGHAADQACSAFRPPGSFLFFWQLS